MNEKKMKKREELLIAKQQEKERIRIHKEMIEHEKNNAAKDKIAPEDSFISLQHINKIYDNHVQAVYDFNLEIKEKEFIVFVGPSGCGKSTTLRMIAGLENITAGDLYIDGQYSNAIQAKNRNIAMVFQSYALYPHLTVYENMAFSLKIQHLSKEEIDKRIQKAAKILELTDYLNRRPNALSGGQCQRVALGRAIVRDSKIFLMDEPLSNLDAKLRVSMRSEIIKLHEDLNATTIYVTHDQTEAMTMATRIVVMNKGYVQQIGTPQEIYNHPANTFVATFIGSPSMNLIDVKLKEDVIFENDYRIKLTDEQKNIVKDFYSNGLKEAENKLQEIEENNAEKKELISKLNSVVEANEKEKIKTEIEIIDKANTTRNELINIINTYKEMIGTNEMNVIFGIRPDEIYEVAELTKKVDPSEKCTIKVRISELLGNQYYIHTTFANKDLTLCTPAERIIKSNEELEIVFNLKKYHLFDSVTKKIIY